MAYTGIKIVFGAASVSSPSARATTAFGTNDDVKKLLDTLEASGVKVIDTAQLYGDSETLLGNAGAANRFIIDTKDLAAFDKEATKEKIIERGKKSLELLKTNKVDIYYLHAPPPPKDLPAFLAGVDALHKAGVFSRFGISNFSPEEVETVYAHCKEKNYVLPTVYQGNYSPVARKQETVLFPTLRKLGIAFYAYSPLAGGFLTKTKQQIQEGAGRFEKGTPLGDMYLNLYSKPSYLEALEKWQAVADKEGVGRAELGFRWVAHNSPLKPEYGDGIVIGASRLEQVSGTVDFLKKGPLSQEAVNGIDKVWKTIEQDAPLDNWHDYAKQNF